MKIALRFSRITLLGVLSIGLVWLAVFSIRNYLSIREKKKVANDDAVLRVVHRKNAEMISRWVSEGLSLEEIDLKVAEQKIGYLVLSSPALVSNDTSIVSMEKAAPDIQVRYIVTDKGDVQEMFFDGETLSRVQEKAIR